MLFYHFLFSRELFETYFDATIQEQFKTLLTAGNTEEATSLLFRILRLATDEKDVPFNTARNQLAQWVHVYTR